MIKISKKDKKNIEREITRQIKEDGKVVELLKNNKKAFKKAGMKIKATTWIDPITNEKKFGGCVEIFETDTDIKILDGINIDVGVNNDFDVMLGISKDFKVSGDKEFSLGGYIDVIDTGKQLYKKIFKDSNEKVNIKVKVGLSKVF